MPELSPTWYTPGHQPTEGTTVRFQVRPLDMPTFWKLQGSMTRRGQLPEFEGVAAAFEYCVIGWEGPPAPFSAAAKREAVKVFDFNWSVWLGQIAAHCYLSAIVSEEEKKTS